VQKAFQYVEPFGRKSRVWQTDGRTYSRDWYWVKEEHSYEVLNETVTEPTNYECIYSMYCRLALHFVSLTKAFEERRPPTIQIRFGFGSGSDLESISGLLKVNGDFPVQRYIYDKNFYKHMISFFLQIWAKLWEEAISYDVKESF